MNPLLIIGGGLAVVGLAAMKGSAPARLSASQIAVFAKNAGFTGQDLQTAVAVALAESDGNPQAYNPETAANTPTNMGSYGLWQIYLNDHPEFAGWNLYDAQTNALAAYQVWKEQGWGAWSTFNRGAYQAYLGVAAQATVGA